MLDDMFKMKGLGIGPFAKENPDNPWVKDPVPQKQPEECPFCHGVNLSTTSNGLDSYAVICDDCGAEGPTGMTEFDAERQWNDRISSGAKRI